MSRADPLRLADYLQHILEAIDNIRDYTVGMDLTAFMVDRKTRDAVVRNLEVIGEACNNVVKHHADFAAEHSTVPWSFAYEMRNALSHGYFTVDHTIVWQTIQQDLPGLRAQIAGIV
ncbi:MAG: DUF86 domain-containing protein [Gammaproteobacteria bacterium]|nr:DUF86 domain-containing protein [Gammaproteobacteria bacterium]MBU0785553.1 DUF86 domain-containing protein [Gammaproteobacteria bacterium]MBU0816841.1 DUF86 domain-containing protein [Gammaproteobacteria bacterium]MBU1787005.1 DUF86 domain-containing protein [Gammaproteobacteria bacterium]